MHEVRRTSAALERVLRAGLLLIVIFTALAHGVVEAWSALLFQWSVAALFFLWVCQVYQARRLELAIPSVAWPLCGLIVVGAIQSVTWLDRAGLRRSLSYDVEATRRTVIMLLCLLICLLIAAHFLRGKEALQMLAHFLPLYGMSLALLALLQHFTAPHSILWWREIRHQSPFGTFINRDHFAGYLELLAGVPVALIATRVMRGEWRFLYLVAALLMGLAVILTLSRGGALSLLIELLCIAALAQRRAAQLGKEAGHARFGRTSLLGVATVGSVLAAIVAGILWIGAEPLINRFATGNPASSDLSKAQSFEMARGTIWRDTWLIIRAQPWLGAGLGAYETAWHIHGVDENESGGVAAQAHNDYLQVLADTGVVGGVLLLGFLVIVLRAMLASTRLRDPLQAGLAIGCSGGLLGLLVHSFFDFNLQLVSHALLFLVLCVVLVTIQATVESGVAPTHSTAHTQAPAPDLIAEVMS